MPSSNTYALNYEVDSISVLVGSFNISQYIDNLSIGLPPISIDIPQLHTGSFTLSLNAQAIADGVTDDNLSEFTNPLVWRKGQKKVTITINGFTLPILRIDEYKYDEVTQIGEGTLVQLPSFFDVFDQKELVTVSPRVGGTSLGLITNKLLDEMKPKVPGSFNNDTPSLEGTYDLPVYFSNIAGLIQQFCGTQQTFLWCDNTERIKYHKVNLFAPNNLIRPNSKFESRRDVSNINFAAEQLKVTGNKEVASLPPPEDSPSPAVPSLSLSTNNASYTEDGFPESYTVTSKSTYGAVLADLKDGVGNSLLTTSNIDTPIVDKVETYYYTYAAYTSGDNAGKRYRISEQISTQKLAGEMYGKLTNSAGISLITSLNVATTLEFSSIVLNTAKGQTITTTKGQAYANAKSATGTTIIDNLSAARSTVVLPQSLDIPIDPKPPYFVPPTPNNPNTGGSVGVQPSVTAEPPLPRSEYDFTTQIYTGSCTVESVGWSTFLPKQLSIDVGFIPNQAIAQRLACWLTKIELGRRDSTFYTLPVPNEWLSNGGRPFQLAYMHNKICLIDQPTIDVIRQGDNNVSVEFSFLGIFLGFASALPDPAPPSPRMATGGLSLVPQNSPFFVVGVAIAPITFSALGGTTPYSWSSTSLPPGLSLSSGGVLSGTPTVIGNTAVTITVTDAGASTDTQTISVIVTGAVVPNSGYVSVFSIVTSTQVSGKVTKGLSGSGLRVVTSALSNNQATDVTPPIISLTTITLAVYVVS